MDSRGREIKRETLVELAEYVNTPVGKYGSYVLIGMIFIYFNF